MYLSIVRKEFVESIIIKGVIESRGMGGWRKAINQPGN